MQVQPRIAARPRPADFRILVEDDGLETEVLQRAGSCNSLLYQSGPARTRDSFCGIILS